MIILGDIGGTKCQLGWANDCNGTIQNITALPSGEFSDFASALDAYLKMHDLGKPEKLAIGVAGPVIDNNCTATNLPWKLLGAEISRQTSASKVTLVNDLVALGHGIDRVPEDQLVILQEGAPKDGNRALIAAGTGLGECILYWDGSRHHPFGTEGGHTDFGPCLEMEIKLLSHLRQSHDRVSWERVVSGKMGFANIYRFLAQEEDSPAPSIEIPSTTPDDEYGPLVHKAASEGCPRADLCLSMFSRLYGAETGNLALKALAVNGIYIAGGIATKLISWIRDRDDFRQGLTRKGRFSPLVAEMPVTLITDKILGLRGCQQILAAD